MQATITVTGNQRDGYTLEVLLPQAWCNQFTPRMGVLVCGDPLCSSWGQLIEGESNRVRKIFRSSVDEVDTRIGNIVDDIKTAKTALANIKDIEKTVIIDL